MEGGLEDEIKEQKAREEEKRVNESEQIDESVIEERKRQEQIKGDPDFEGEMVIQKTQLKNSNKGDLLGNVMSGVGNIAMFGGDLVLNQLKFLKNKPWFAIKKGVLY